MASNVPGIKQVTWFSIIPQVVVLALIISGYYFADSDYPVLYGVSTGNFGRPAHRIPLKTDQ